MGREEPATCRRPDLLRPTPKPGIITNPSCLPPRTQKPGMQTKGHQEWMESGSPADAPGVLAASPRTWKRKDAKDLFGLPWGGGMLGWIERVVPQPPVPHLTEEPPPAPVRDPEPAKAPTRKAGGPGDAADRARTEETEKKVGFAVPEDPGSVFESVGSSVLSWLSQGLEKVIPQPVPAPGTLQALGKSFETSIDVPDQTEVQILRDEEEDALEITPFDPEEDEVDNCGSEAASDTRTEEWAGARVLGWLVQGFERMVPQPETLKKPELEPKEPKCEAAAGGTKGTKSRAKAKSSVSAAQSIPGAVEPAVAEGQPEPVATFIPRSLAGDGSRMFAWFVQGLEKVMPQPVTREKQDTQGVVAATSSPVEERGKGA